MTAAQPPPRVNFLEAVEHGYRNAFNFSGRASRSEFWWFSLYYAIVIFGGALLFGLLTTPDSMDVFALLFFLWVVVNIVPQLSVSVRRLHDAGHSGWWLPASLIPFVGFVVLVFYLLPTGPDNRWGPGSSAALTASEEELRARAESGELPWAILPFEGAKLELARTGKRRVFVCGRCGKGVSLAWKNCDHCKATFDEFPPRDTGRII
jgi:uncharacterized membrane protein YhaH (DUF805 family)